MGVTRWHCNQLSPLTLTLWYWRPLFPCSSSRKATLTWPPVCSSMSQSLEEMLVVLSLTTSSSCIKATWNRSQVIHHILERHASKCLLQDQRNGLMYQPPGSTLRHYGALHVSPSVTEFTIVVAMMATRTRMRYTNSIRFVIIVRPSLVLIHMQHQWQRRTLPWYRSTVTPCAPSVGLVYPLVNYLLEPHLFQYPYWVMAADWLMNFTCTGWNQVYTLLGQVYSHGYI